MHGTQFSWSASVFYFAFLIWQPAVSYMTQHFPLGKLVSVSELCIKRYPIAHGPIDQLHLLGPGPAWAGLCQELCRLHGSPLLPGKNSPSWSFADKAGYLRSLRSAVFPRDVFHLLDSGGTIFPLGFLVQLLCGDLGRSVRLCDG